VADSTFARLGEGRTDAMLIARRGNSRMLRRANAHGTSRDVHHPLFLTSMSGLGYSQNHTRRLGQGLLLKPRPPTAIRIQRLPRRRQAKSRSCRCAAEEDISRSSTYYTRPVFSRDVLTILSGRRRFDAFYPNARPSDPAGFGGADEEGR
jgi:hypothetical protein